MIGSMSGGQFSRTLNVKTRHPHTLKLSYLGPFKIRRGLFDVDPWTTVESTKSVVEWLWFGADPPGATL